MATNRVIESFPLYDTVLISKWVDDQEGWFQTYQALGQKNKVSFFDKRNSSDVGMAYCNLDAKERFPYGYIAYSFGVLFQGPALGDGERDTERATPQSRADISHLWTFELPKHVAVRIKLGQDYILDTNVLHSPSGTAAKGSSTSIQSGGGSIPILGIATTQTGAFGEPQLVNRWEFPEPYLRIPNNSVFSIELEFSDYAREILKAVPGPGDYYWGRPVPNGTFYQSFPAASMIQVGLIGKRAVAQRGEQAYMPQVAQ
ncbi:MAG: hypothetical protein QNJ97_25160 [Myxococcota bacterium]|nr:hypothetical protein [Myxococcota bacterium]